MLVTECLHELLELYLMDVFADDFVIAGVADNVDTAQEGNG